jgi:hypothetical protein
MAPGLRALLLGFLGEDGADEARIPSLHHRRVKKASNACILRARDNAGH